MKRILTLMLTAVLLLTGCTMNGSTESYVEEVVQSQTDTTTSNMLQQTEISVPESASDFTETELTVTEPVSEAIIADAPMPDSLDNDSGSDAERYAAYVESLQYTSMSDPDLLRFIEDSVYTDTIQQLEGGDYVVEKVEAVYVSKEYLDELEYNSRENEYFGYKLSELDEAFQGEKYIFTLSEDGQTIVVPFDDYDGTYVQMARSVAIGTGVILLCVTISAVAGLAGNPAISMVFSVAAESAFNCALSTAIISGVVAGVVEGYQTQDVEMALKEAALQASNGFMIGAIIGAVSGGFEEAYTISQLRNLAVTENGLTLPELVQIQRESGYPLDVIQQFHSMDEYMIYRDAGLTTHMVDGKLALLQDIDLNYTSQLSTGETITNLQKMLNGNAPLEPATGLPYELHHIGQKADGTLAVLTHSQHQGNSEILNIAGKASEIDRNVFGGIRKEFWKDVGKQYELGLVA